MESLGPLCTDHRPGGENFFDGDLLRLSPFPLSLSFFFLQKNRGHPWGNTGFSPFFSPSIFFLDPVHFCHTVGVGFRGVHGQKFGNQTPFNKFLKPSRTLIWGFGVPLSLNGEGWGAKNPCSPVGASSRNPLLLGLAKPNSWINPKFLVSGIRSGKGPNFIGGGAWYFSCQNPLGVVRARGFKFLPPFPPRIRNTGEASQKKWYGVEWGKAGRRLWASRFRVPPPKHPYCWGGFGGKKRGPFGGFGEGPPGIGGGPRAALGFFASFFLPMIGGGVLSFFS